MNVDDIKQFMEAKKSTVFENNYSCLKVYFVDTTFDKSTQAD